MADQTSGSAAPEGMETKTMPAEFHSDPNVVRPAPVPFGDSTHIDRGEGHTPAETKPAETGETKKTTSTRKTGSSSN